MEFSPESASLTTCILDKVGLFTASWYREQISSQLPHPVHFAASTAISNLDSGMSRAITEAMVAFRGIGLALLREFWLRRII
jgi:hypothetical protein